MSTTETLEQNGVDIHLCNLMQFDNQVATLQGGDDVVRKQMKFITFAIGHNEAGPNRDIP